MAKLVININYSHQMTDITVIVPDYVFCEKNGLFEGDKKLPVLWLFHDYGGDSNDYVRYAQLELLARDENCLIVCPSAANSYYVDSAQYMQYYTLIENDLREYVLKTFPASRNVKDHYVAGCGMGGYGALYHAFMSENYGFAASMDGDLEAPARFKAGDMARFQNPHVFEAKDQMYDLGKLMREANTELTLFIAYREDNEFIQANQAFCDMAVLAGRDIKKTVYRQEDQGVAVVSWLKEVLGHVK